MTGPVYPEMISKADMDYAIPDEETREKIDNIIFNELVYGEVRPDSKLFFLDVVSGLKKERCDGVVLGCTEIPLIVLPDESTLPVLDSTRILARAALRAAMNSEQ